MVLPDVFDKSANSNFVWFQTDMRDDSVSLLNILRSPVVCSRRGFDPDVPLRKDPRLLSQINACRRSLKPQTRTEATRQIVMLAQTAQNVPCVTISGLMPFTFMPKYEVKKLRGRNTIVTIVKIRIALLLDLSRF